MSVNDRRYPPGVRPVALAAVSERERMKAHPHRHAGALIGERARAEVAAPAASGVAAVHGSFRTFVDGAQPGANAPALDGSASEPAGAGGRGRRRKARHSPEGGTV